MEIAGHPIEYIIQCEFLHATYALLWCAPVLVLWWILTTYSQNLSDMMEDSCTKRLVYVGLFSLLVGLAFCSHLYADINKLGF